MQETVELGELIRAVFAQAKRQSTDPQELSRLATQAAAQMLWAHLRKQTRPQPAHDPN
jgi:hypothetical protein